MQKWALSEITQAHVKTALENVTNEQTNLTVAKVMETAVDIVLVVTAFT